MSEPTRSVPDLFAALQRSIDAAKADRRNEPTPTAGTLADASCEHRYITKTTYDDGYICTDEPSCHERLYTLSWVTERAQSEEVVEKVAEAWWNEVTRQSKDGGFALPYETIPGSFQERAVSRARVAIAALLDVLGSAS